MQDEEIVALHKASKEELSSSSFEATPSKILTI
jgi:hypothetical protein